jgi:NAD(P)-dependent dehydrogenase (short-subunit alcohol dehydrogenase family)
MPPSSLSFLVTGAARGIGRHLTRDLLNKGHRVFLVDNNRVELDHFTNILAHTLQSNTRYRASLTDLRDPAHIRNAAEQASDFFSGHLDCLINNAAYTAGVGGNKFAELDLETWNASIETNLTAPMLLSQACLPMLSKSSSRKQGGCIIHMSSTRAFMSEPHNEPYSTTKAGLVGLTQSMAVSLADVGVRVNAILPGWINVGFECKEGDEKGLKWEDGLSEEDQRWHLTGRVGKGEDVVRAVEYLVDAKGVTGVECVVDGGVTRRMVYPE